IGLANRTDCVSNLLQRRRTGGSGKVLFQICVFEPGSTVTAEAIGDLKHNVTVSLRGIKDAAAVSKATLAVVQIMHLASRDFQGAHAGNGFRCLLPVSPYILDGRAACSAGNAAQAFNPTVVGAHRVSDK